MICTGFVGDDNLVYVGCCWRKTRSSARTHSSVTVYQLNSNSFSLDVTFSSFQKRCSLLFSIYWSTALQDNRNQQWYQVQNEYNLLSKFEINVVLEMEWKIQKLRYYERY